MGELQQQQQQQQQQPTFSWTGAGRHEGSRIFYSSFNFAGEPYALGDCVYLLPEEEGAPSYIAKLMRAWEDTAAADAEKLIIEVRWYERRSAVPAVLAASMHEREVVASSLLDTNLVGCLDSRATVVRASSYEEACELMQAVLPQAGRKGEWHFCRGVLDSASHTFRTFQELGIGPLDDEFGAEPEPSLMVGGISAAALISQGFAGSTAAYCNGMQQQQQYEDAAMHDAAGEPDGAATSKGGSGKGGSVGSNSNRSRRAGAAARVAAAAAAAGAAAGGNGIRGIPGKVCCECGATQTPQWREGPQGPKTLCNACGVRYQRSQSKAKSNKRQASERARSERGSPSHARAPKQACLANRAAAPACGDSSKAAADAAAAAAGGHGHGTRSASKGGGRHAGAQQQHGSRPRSGVSGMSGHAGSNAAMRSMVQQQQQRHGQQHMVAHGGAMGPARHGMFSELHFYEDEGSPPGMHTHILEEDEEEDEQQQVLLADTLNRSATHEAADVLQTLSLPQQQQQHRLPQLHRQQQQQQQQHGVPMSAGYCGLGIGSPSSSMLLVDQLQPDSMPLLSLNDSSLTGVGPDGVLMGGPDSLDPSLNPSSFPNPGLQPHSLSPLPRSHRVSSSAVGSSRLGATGGSGASARLLCYGLHQAGWE
ncbi:hypothetical protein OEZ85_003067 [Tetradesmus obliquus]|uniref:GATA-type domain-containing protein n=1 Tax=Tetradesmus obliquus TaxID=3088 RepID=A0ABY8TZG7_TETOB|nr:hypothetical protein OEZ85_003067 [Tetradesmus obliquus]